MRMQQATRRFGEAVSKYESPLAVPLYWALALRGNPERPRRAESEIIRLLKRGLRYAEIRKRLLEGARG